MWFEKGMLESRKGEDPDEDWDVLRYLARDVGVGGKGLATGSCQAGRVSHGRRKAGQVEVV